VAAVAAFSILLAGSAVAQGPSAWPQLSLVKRFSGLAQPVLLTSAMDGTGRVFIVERVGRVRVVVGGTLQGDPFLDISSKVTCCDTRGLLSLAFPPDFSDKKYFYVYYTNAGGDAVVARYYLTANPNVADPNSEQRILVVTQPYTNHHGGHIAFGPDGYLYIGLGDGGGSGDPNNYAQNPMSLLGKILRIDTESDTEPYAIPASNPFARTAGYRAEIWALGLRSPWRFSFDRMTRDLFIADQGETRFEEVDVEQGGAGGGQNYGWRLFEGNYPAGATFTDLVLPVFQYPRAQGCAVSGGYVYRGTLYPRMQGVYLFGDQCSGTIWGLRRSGGAWLNAILAQTPFSLTGFGEDEAGNVYAADQSGGDIFMLTDPSVMQPYTYLIPAVAHNTGANHVLWRSDIAAVNLSGLPAKVKANFLDGTNSGEKAVTLAPGSSTEWVNVLESLFQMTPDTSDAGVVELASDQPLYVTSRSYASSAEGEKGQNYPALTAADALVPGRLGVLPQIKRNATAYTNIGVINLGSQSVTVGVKLFDIAGNQIGGKVFTVDANRWVQQYDIFTDTGAGDQNGAYATVEVYSAEGRAWAYASVINRLSRDPTTVPLIFR
jgi:glucose/arabinose dehydrogenase